MQAWPPRKERNKMKQLFHIVPAVLALCLTLSACGGGNEEAAAFDPDATAQALLDSGAFSDALEEVDLSVAATLYGVDEADLTDGTVYMSLSAGAEEIAVLVLADADAAAAALEGLEAHVADQRAALENYQPDEVSKLDGAILQQKGSSVLLAVCADPEAAKAVLGELG